MAGVRARYVQVRRHTDSDGDVLTEEGVKAALEIGRRLTGPYRVAGIERRAAGNADACALCLHPLGAGELGSYWLLHAIDIGP